MITSSPGAMSCPSGTSTFVSPASLGSLTTVPVKPAGTQRENCDVAESTSAPVPVAVAVSRSPSPNPTVAWNAPYPLASVATVTSPRCRCAPP